MLWVRVMPRLALFERCVFVLLMGTCLAFYLVISVSSVVWCLPEKRRRRRKEVCPCEVTGGPYLA